MIIKRRITYGFLLCLLVILTVHQKGNAQNAFKHFTVNEGLPSNEVYDIYQDDKGYIWFATDRGVSRFNGYNFQNFTTNDGLTDNSVLRFYPQPNGQIWCATFNKDLCYFDPLTLKFTEFEYNHFKREIPEYTIINGLYLNNENSLFIGFINGLGFIEIDKAGNIQNYLFEGSPSEAGHVQIIQCNAADKCVFNFLWPENTELPGIFNRKNIISVISPEMHFYQTASNTEESLIIDYRNIYVNGELFESNEHYSFPVSAGFIGENMCIGFRNNGINIYSKDLKTVAHYLPETSISKVLKDDENGIWMSSLEDGVFYIPNIEVETVQLPKNLLESTNSLTKDNNNNLIIGSSNGNIIKIDSTERVEILYENELMYPAFVHFNNYQGKLIACSDYKIMLFEDGQPHTYKDKISCTAISEEQVENNLIGSYGVYFKIGATDTITNITGLRTTDICQYDEQVLIGTLEGVFKYSADGVSPFYVDNKTYSKRVTDIDVWEDKLIVATIADGLFIKDNDQVVHLHKGNGLPDNLINSIYVQDKNTFWICTNSGVARIVNNTKGGFNCSILDKNFGLPDNEAYDLEIIDGIVWVGTRTGICKFPESILYSQHLSNQKNLYLNGLKVNEIKKEPNYLSSLAYNENRIQFEFEAVTFRHNKDLLYRYKLEGLDKKWNYTKNKSALYSSLPYGEYLFKLQVQEYDKTWPDTELTIPIVISPPYYKTWWFRVVVILLIIVVVWSFFKIRILTYNRDIVRELMRHLLKKVRKEKHFLVVRESGKDVRIDTNTILYVRSDGNYLEIKTENGRFMIREKIGEFLSLVPDPLEFLRIRRSHIIRIDKVEKKSKKEVVICGEKIAVGKTYKEEIEKILF